MNHERAPTPDPDAAGRAGVVAVVGRANVGKSTLVNALLGEKVSIVSPVAQTTRNLIRGILSETRGQIVFLDTPGVHPAQSDLGKVMNRIARASIKGVDAILLVLDGSVRPRIEDEGWLRRLSGDATQVIAALNKSDLANDFGPEYRRLWDRIAAEKNSERAPAWIRLSALANQDVNALITQLFERMPIGPLLFPDDMLTDFPKRLNIGDIVREKYFQFLKQELPHSVAVWVEDLIEGKDRWDVHVVIYVERPSQKGIVIGDKGRVLRRVRRSSEAELSDMYGIPIRLALWVKVEKNWSKNFWILKKLGYVKLENDQRFMVRPETPLASFAMARFSPRCGRSLRTSLPASHISEFPKTSSSAASRSA